MASQHGTKPDFWRQAVESLSSAPLECLKKAKTGKKDVALASLKVAKQKRNLALQRKWQIKKISTKDKIIIRDALERLIAWTQRYLDTGNSGASNTRTAALPWAAIRFVLQSVNHGSIIYADLMDDMATVARTLAISRKLERSYLHSPEDHSSEVVRAFVATYAAILDFLAAAVSLLASSDIAHIDEEPSWHIYTKSRKKLLSNEIELLQNLPPSNRAEWAKINKEVPRLADPILTSYKKVKEQEYLEFSRWMPQVRPTPSLQSTDIKVPAIEHWLFQHPSFLSWTSTSSNSTLVVRMTKGWNRTTLCSAFVNLYRDAQTASPNMAPLAYVDCNPSEFGPSPPSAEMVIRSLARQLAVPSTPAFAVHSAALAVFARKKPYHSALRPGPVEDYVEVILAVLEENPAVIVVDGLDRTDYASEIAHGLALITLHSKNVVKILATDAVTSDTYSLMPSAESISPKEEVFADDLLLFANDTITKSKSRSKLLRDKISPAVQARLAQTLALKSRGHFELIRLQLQRFCSTYDGDDIIAALDDLSPQTQCDEEEFQYGCITNSDDRTRNIATHAFAWALYAKETLSIEVILSAIRIGTKLEDIDIEEVIEICQAFLVVDAPSKTTHFSCRSAQTFLRCQEALKSDEAHSILAAVCLSTCSQSVEVTRTTIEPGQNLYDYAIVYLGYHCSRAQYAQNADIMGQKLKTFFIDGTGSSPAAKAWMAGCRLAAELLPAEHAQKSIISFVGNSKNSSLFPICTYGLSGLLPDFPWPTDYNWNERNDKGMTALEVASRTGHLDAVKHLLHTEAISEYECSDFNDALRSAAFEGHGSLAIYLISWSPDNRVDDRVYTAISGACEGGNPQAAYEILLSVKIDNQKLCEAILRAFCEAGFTTATRRAVSFLLEERMTLFSMRELCAKVIASGNVENLGHLHNRSPLVKTMPPASVAIAARHGREVMTRYLLDQGCDINEEGELGSALRCASICGSANICRLLIDRGVAVDENSKFGSALHAAAMNGHLHIVRILVDAGADVNIKGGHYGNPLQAAAFHGEEEIVSLLLQAGANSHQPGFSKDAFHAAVEGGHKAVIETLLGSGFAISPAISSMASDCNYMAEPPPRNLLREASPDGKQRMRSWRRDYGGRHKFDDDDADTETESETSKGDDWIDLGDPKPHARAYLPLSRKMDGGFISDDEEPFRPNERHRSNYPLEAAAAGNHLDIVIELLMQHDFLGLDDGSLNQALVAACRNGHERVAKELLNRFEDDNIPLRAALSKAASHSHVSIVRILLAHDRAAESRFDRLKATVEASIHGKNDVFHEVLAIAKGELSQAEIKDILLHCLKTATKTDRADVLEVIISVTEPEITENLLEVLFQASKDGKLAAVRTIHRALSGPPLSRSKFSRCNRLAVENGRTEIVRYLLPKLKERGNMKYLRNLILAAAGSGYLDILESLFAFEVVSDQKLLQQALNASAENGHEAVCRYLLGRGVNPCLEAPTVVWSDISVDRGLSALLLAFSNKALSDSEDESATAPDKPQIESANDDGKDWLPLYAHSRPLTAIEQCIRGFYRFESRDDFFWIHRGSHWREETEAKQQSCLTYLLQNVPYFADAKWDEAVCAVARLCPPALLASMLEKQANPRAQFKNKSALYYAASRESLCFPVMRMLIDNIPKHDIPEIELRSAIAMAVSQFRIHSGRPDSQGALFSDTKSLKQLFSTGPGAAVELLLPLLPSGDISDMNTSALLQCVAAAGMTDLFRLLVSYKVKVNELDSYYGTALQAAARFGQTDIVKILLDAGAEANTMRQGKHHNALRAAVLGGSTDIVTLLLQKGVDLEASANWSYSPDDEDDPTALQLAVQHKFPDIALILIDAGANIHAKGTYQQCLFIQACRLGEIRLIEKLLESAMDVQARGHIVRPWGEVRPEEISGMHAAIEADNVDVVHHLLSRGFRVFADFEGSNSPLAFAAQKGKSHMVELLLTADPSVSDHYLFSATTAAFGLWGHSHVNYAVVEKLLFHRPSLFEGNNAREILRRSCNQDDLSITELVLEELAYRDEVQQACTAVMNSPPSTMAQTLEILLEYVPITTNFFVEACACGWVDVVKLGLDQGMTATASSSSSSDGTSAMHVAVLRGHATVVEQLMASGADVNAIDGKFGSLLRTALETHVAERLIDKALPEEIEARTKMLTRMPRRIRQVFPLRQGKTDVFTYQQARNLENVVRLLVEKGCSTEIDQSPFGSVLAMAAFLGIRKVYDLLVTTQKISMDGGYLQSPLAAAIEGSHMELARLILATPGVGSSSTSMAGDLLHVACENGDLPAIKLLLSQNVNLQSRNAAGLTPLQVILPKLEQRDFSQRYDERSHGDIIANTLVDDSSMATITDQDLISAAKIKDEKVREPLLQKMITKARSEYFPIDGIKALSKHNRFLGQSPGGAFQRLLDEKRVEEVTFDILCAVDDAATFEQLLDYGPKDRPKYCVTSGSIAIVEHNRSSDKREIVNLLLRRAESLVPTEQNVLTVLRHTSPRGERFFGEGAADTLDTMFSRNSTLNVTEEMLISAANSRDLDFLLKRITPAHGLLTEAVFEAFGEKYVVGQSDQILKLLLSFDKTIKIPAVFVNQYIGLCGLKALESFWAFDASLVLPANSLITLVRQHTRGHGRSEGPHEDLLKLLAEHKGQWEFTKEVQDALDERFPEQSDQKLKDKYMSVLEG